MTGKPTARVDGRWKSTCPEAPPDAAPLSEKGVTLVRREHPPLHLPTRAREVSDVSGAGDTMVAALAVALGAGAALPEAAMALANITAGISVGKQGTATVSREELLGALAPRSPRGERP